MATATGPTRRSPGGSTADLPHLLNDHLRAVGLQAEQFAAPSARELARLAGLWHDLGKRRIGFQRFIRSAGGAEAHIEGRVPDRDKTHSAAGALWAAQWLAQSFGAKGHLLSRLLQYVIAGHHAGLDDWENSGLEARLAKPETLKEFHEALARATPADILQPPGLALDVRGVPLVADERLAPGRLALWTRMLFSALVDADFLDTEAYFSPGRAGGRSGALTASELKPAFDAYLQNLIEASRQAADTPVNRARASILAQCRAKAALPPGVFSLTVPTGGGKTLSSLGFALDHAARHGKRRVVYAIPYTSIIEQTADVFRQVFAPLGEDVVIEHHSNAEPAQAEQETARSRLACENWDAPLIVTTNVQLFESLFARKTSRCRKLHNLRDSVIVLDEAQLLPVEFLQPIVDVLRYLAQDFGVTVLLCTATQPGLTAQAGPDVTRGLRRGICAAGARVTEIIDDVPTLYRDLERVRVQLPADLQAPRPWEEIADEVASHEAVLAIVSRRADAQTLYGLVKSRTSGPSGPEANAAAQAACWHLSALMCAQHRSDTIASIKRALQARRDALSAGRTCLPVRVISTQLVEAGVDLDFPVVYRALAGLDSIAQAAGRCNREGRLAGMGEVHVFVPPTEPPPGLLRLARDRCRLIWHDQPAAPFALDLIDSYFKGLYADAPSTDAKGIGGMLKLDVDRDARTLSIGFRSAAEAFKLIDDKDGATVLVRYRSPNAREDIDALIRLLERDGPARWLMRKLQRYGVTVYRHQLPMLVARGDVRELPSCPGLYVQTEGWDGFYDPVLGARVDSAPGDPAAYVA
jgi:CRISPR-associated endonuclease/helicase Cas3